MALIDVLQQREDRRTVRVRRSLGLKLLLAEYRRAVAAEAFYEQLRCASGATPSGKVARSELARAVFEKLYQSPK
jgi:hypothetical protein